MSPLIEGSSMIPLLPSHHAMITAFTRVDSSLAGPVLRGFTQIAEAWGLSDTETSAVLGRSLDDAFAQVASEKLDERWRETLQRVSYVMGIYKALHILFPSARQANGWVRRPNNGAPFKGGTALDLMCAGRLGDLAVVREYLEAQGLAEP